VCQSRQIPFLFPWIASALGYTYALAGRVAESLPLLEQAAERDASMRLVAHQSRAVAYVTCSLLAEENGDQALI
jgi:hypothetical protein